MRSATFVIEATSQGNIEDLREMRAANANAHIRFVEVAGATHFSDLALSNEVIAHKILEDAGDTTAIQLSDAELAAAMAAPGK